AFMNSGAIKWTDLGQMTWKQCTVEASKRAAMMTATEYTNKNGWYSHRNGQNAMTGVWSNYRSQSINTPYPCVVRSDPNVKFDPQTVLSDTTTYDGQVWHYQDFGVKFYDECQSLATQYGSMIITPWTIGLNKDNYWVQSVHQCNTYEWITNNGSSFGNDN